MQSVQYAALLEERKDKEQNLLIVWKDTDMSRAKAVRALAEVMEQLYIMNDMHEMVKNISSEIRRFLLESGANHPDYALDYLHEKYKRDWEKKNLIEDNTASQVIYHNNVPVILQKDPLTERTKDEVQQFEEYAEQIEMQREINKQAAKVRGIALPNQDTFTSSTTKDYISEHTPRPHYNYQGSFYDAWKDYVAAVKSYYETVKNMLVDINDWAKFETPEEKEQERQLTRAVAYEIEFFDTWSEVHAPFKDLKYATSQRNWFNILLKFLNHGKHAAAVMDPIATFKEGVNRTLTREEVGDEVFLKEVLLEKWAMHQDYCDYIKRYFTDHPERLYDRDEELIEIRKEYIGKLIKLYANRKDFFEYACNFREERMDSPVAERRDNAHDTLSGLA